MAKTKNFGLEIANRPTVKSQVNHDNIYKMIKLLDVGVLYEILSFCVCNNPKQLYSYSIGTNPK